MKLKGKTAIVTGGSAGIGRAIALRLGDEGANVAICARSRETLEQAADGLATRGISILAQRCDVQDPHQIETFVAQVVERFGPVDILVNNAGENQPTPLQEPDDAAWQRNIRTGLDGAYYCTTRVLPHMPDGGRLLYIASITAKFGVAGSSGYCAAKHGLLGLVRSAALELASRRITVNAICPGWVETDLAQTVMRRVSVKLDRDYADTRDLLLRQVPLGEIIQPEEVAGLAAYLVSAEARNITGQAYNLCGGQVMD